MPWLPIHYRSSTLTDHHIFLLLVKGENFIHSNSKYKQTRIKEYQINSRKTTRPKKQIIKKKPLRKQDFFRPPHSFEANKIFQEIL